MTNRQQKICILLSSYNGNRYIAEQLDSIKAQTHTNWVVIVSDDGSTDDTLKTLKEYQASWGKERLSIRTGPQNGFCANFLSMACDQAIQADFYAFCDQDDVWYPDKLSYILQKFDWESNSKTPTLYCGRTEIVDPNLYSLGISQNFTKKPSFKNALVQSIAGGNTMMFNPATKRLLENVGVKEAVSHDWWVYQLVSGAGGFIFYDTKPLIKYRQHSNSLIGENITYLSQFRRLSQAFNNRYKNWNTTNLLSLQSASNFLTKKNLTTLNAFKQLKQSPSFTKRIKLLYSTGLYRQSNFETFKLWIACILNKI